MTGKVSSTVLAMG